ncbi:hypothetical protein L6164_012734 [Bauhinia variegata]|uniref:Uncharacterized protein n=1 Tax=Bauhinia variegata TaxID=167791 RepID=A0ACB9PB47_BAUVA|nr:hypothetical protein L6164_012734 [Bauhinia variegata]
MAISLAANMCSIISSKTSEGIKRFDCEDKLKSRSNLVLPSSEASSSRRQALVSVSTSLVTMAFSYGLSPLLAWAEEKSSGKRKMIKELLEPSKLCLILMRKQILGRRTADAAKESIREYLSSWKGQQTVAQEESYVVLEKAIRSLANFYSRAGPSAPLPEEVKSEILDDLNTAEEFL